ncbi:MAG: regulator of PEP synthase PpsR (kinase-PPPase family) [Kiritimatiellia bacterium]
MEVDLSDDVPRPRPIYILSDSTGETAEKVVRAALRQFRGHVVLVKTFPKLEHIGRVQEVLHMARHNNAMLVSTFVSTDMRAAVSEEANRLGLHNHDLLGALLGKFESFLQTTPVEVPGLLHSVDDNYFRRIAAIEFTVKADDGQEPRMLRDADIVLVGISRTSKTPLSTYLAYKGYKVGNVPLILDRPPPKQLFDVEPHKVVALTIDPQVLIRIRSERIRAMGLMASTNYSDMDYIMAELEYAKDLFRGNPEWPVINVTNQAIEETAATILRLFQQRGVTIPLGGVS